MGQSLDTKEGFSTNGWEGLKLYSNDDLYALSMIY